MVYPLLNSLRLSFFTMSDQKEVFRGLQNYVTLFTDPQFADTFWNALATTWSSCHPYAGAKPNRVAVGGAACFARARRGLYRTTLFMPTVLSVVIIGFIWQLILNPLWGVAESLLKVVGLGFLFKPWLGLPSALLTLSLISVWQFVGIPMILFYTALIGIPEELVEAAHVDGASGWDIFWRIKFPLVLPTLGIVAILTFVGNFNAFDLIYTMKGALAGPNFATTSWAPSFTGPSLACSCSWATPTMGATVAAMMFLIILTGVMIYLFVWQRRIQTYEM